LHLNVFGKSHRLESNLICEKCLTDEEQKIAKKMKMEISVKLPKVLLKEKKETHNFSTSSC
jgi:reverse gyrase